MNPTQPIYVCHCILFLYTLGRSIDRSSTRSCARSFVGSLVLDSLGSTARRISNRGHLVGEAASLSTIRLTSKRIPNAQTIPTPPSTYMYIFILYCVLQTRPYAYRSWNCRSLMYRSMRGFFDVSNRFRRGFDDSSRCSCLIGVVAFKFRFIVARIKGCLMKSVLRQFWLACKGRSVACRDSIRSPSPMPHFQPSPKAPQYI
ncbi:hypothetical protein HDV57DRAFT_62244 [Trichoderma longibrachiatum]